MRNCAILLFLFTTQVFAKDLSLVAATGDTGLSLPSISYLTNVSPKINDNGDISFHVMALIEGEYRHGIFIKDSASKEGSLKKLLPVGEYIGDMSLTNSNRLIFTTNDGSQSLGVFDYDYTSGVIERPIPWDSKFFSISSAHMSDRGVLSYRLIENQNERQLVTSDISGNTIKTAPIFKEGVKGVSYVFSPRQAGNYILIKVRYGDKGDFSESRPDRLWLVNTKTGRRSPVALDKDTMPSSKIKSINNMYTVNSKGNVAFWAHTEKGRQLLTYRDGFLKAILTEGVEYKKLDWFSPGMNDNGDIVVRGTKLNGKQMLAIYKNGTWKDLVVENDGVDHFNGRFVISKRRDLTFIGAVDINNNSEVVFNANTINTESNERVEAVFKIEL